MTVVLGTIDQVMQDAKAAGHLVGQGPPPKFAINGVGGLVEPEYLAHCKRCEAVVIEGSQTEKGVFTGTLLDPCPMQSLKGM